MCVCVSLCVSLRLCVCVCVCVCMAIVQDQVFVGSFVGLFSHVSVSVIGFFSRIWRGRTVDKDALMFERESVGLFYLSVCV